MENMEKNEIVTTEVIGHVTEAIPAKTSALKTAGLIGITMVCAVVINELIVQPMVNKVIRAVEQGKAVKRAEKAAVKRSMCNHMELDEIPDIE